MRVSFEDELQLIKDVLVAYDVPASEAWLQASWLAEADIRGHASHGLQRLPVLIGRIQAGLISPGVPPNMTWGSPSVLQVDGRGGLGPVVAVAAVDQLLERVQETGLAAAAVRSANHLGLLAPYVERIVGSGNIGIAMCTSEALVHAWGGNTRMVGTNPLAIGVPAEPRPLIVDMATSAVSMGRVLNYQTLSKPLEGGWAIDQAGQPTINANAAASGALSPFGGAKGYALALAIGAVVGSLTGGHFGGDVRGTLDTEFVATKGDLFFVINPAVFGVEDASDKLARYLTAVRHSGPAGGRDEVSIPGDRARFAREAGLRDGVTVVDKAWADAVALLQRVPPRGK